MKYVDRNYVCDYYNIPRIEIIQSMLPNSRRVDLSQYLVIYFSHPSFNNLLKSLHPYKKCKQY